MNLNLVLSLLAFCGVVTDSKPASISKIQLAIENVKFAVYDKWISTPNISTIKINTKDSKVPVVDKAKKLLAKFTIKDTSKNAAIVVQHASVVFDQDDGSRKIFFVAEPDETTKEYSVEVDFKSHKFAFDGLNCTYEVRLVVGDSNAANAFDWNFADIKATFASEVRFVPTWVNDEILKKPEPGVCQTRITQVILIGIPLAAFIVSCMMDDAKFWGWEKMVRGLLFMILVLPIVFIPLGRCFGVMLFTEMGMLVTVGMGTLAINHLRKLDEKAASPKNLLQKNQPRENGTKRKTK